jgi:hypothetical protein
MVSTFDLTLLGSLVSVGGVAFLRQAKWPHLGWTWLSGRQAHPSGSIPENRDDLERAVTTTGARWLTMGALTLFLAYAHGGEEGYLFGPWTDVMFHVAFVSSCWAATAYRITRTAGQPNHRPSSTASLPETSLAQTTD